MIETDGNQDEQVLLVVHKHWASFMQDALFVLLPAFVAILLLLGFSGFSYDGAIGFLHIVASLLFPVCILSAWIMAAMLWTKHSLGMLVVTDQRIFDIEQSGFVQRSVYGWNVPDILRADARRAGVLESLFNFGAVELVVRDQGEAQRIEGIPNPEYVSSVILSQDERFGQLRETARKQRELLHFLSHEVKGHLTKSKAAFASIVEGDYGPVAAPLDTLAHRALEDSERGVETVMSILDDADLSHGGIKFDMRPFDLAQALHRVAEQLRPSAEAKQLAFEVLAPDSCVVVGDEMKIERHVLRNLIDNAIRYTPSGAIQVSLEITEGVARFSVADTGVGIAEDDMKKLFTEGGHGEHSRDVNAESTGYGLFVAKQVVDAHGGRIWAQSAGPGTGSTFCVEFPLSKN